jgi:pSer/pThr/pTyr-binding forkhead associated (FHA) protein
MHVVLQGSLFHFGVRDLLAFLARSPHEGTFDAESNGERARLALRGGHVVAAEGAQDPAEVVAKLLQWTDGTFTFLDEIVLSEEVAPLDVEALIVEAEMRIAEMRRVTELFPDDGVRFRVVNRPPGEINITAEEFQILFQIGSGKSLAQLLRDSGRPAADLYPIVKRLQMTGLVETAGDPDATSPKPTSAVAPASAPVQDTTPVVPVAAPPPLELELEPAPPPVSAKTLVEERPPAAAESTQREQPAPTGGPTLQSIESPLVATLTADDGIMHPLLEETCTVGRTAANTIALRDSSVSAKHARIVRTAEGFTIEDLGSRNGTFVNSEKLTEKRLLVEGDLVRLGKIILTFNLASDVKKQQSTEREMMK